jgi:hypothetical protein
MPTPVDVTPGPCFDQIVRKKEDKKEGEKIDML